MENLFYFSPVVDGVIHGIHRFSTNGEWTYVFSDEGISQAEKESPESPKRRGGHVLEETTGRIYGLGAGWCDDGGDPGGAPGAHGDPRDGGGVERVLPWPEHGHLAEQETGETVRGGVAVLPFGLQRGPGEDVATRWPKERDGEVFHLSTIGE